MINVFADIIQRTVVFLAYSFVFVLWFWTKVFLNYWQHKVSITIDQFLSFIPFVKFIIVAHKFGANAT